MPPTYTQAGFCTEVTHYLKAIQAPGSDNADEIVAELREMKINDFMTKDGQLREHARVMRGMYLRGEVCGVMKIPVRLLQDPGNDSGWSGVETAEGR